MPNGSPQINNAAIAHNAINPVSYKGGRFSALAQINDDWSALVTQTYQHVHSDGVFYQMPKSSDGVALKAGEVTLFNNSYDDDKFSNTAWTLNGKIGALNAVYTGGYLNRTVDQVQDYTNYARGVYADYYQCYGPGSGVFSTAGNYAIYGTGDRSLTSTCGSPSATWREQERTTHLTNEFRISAPDDWRLRFVAGVYAETLRIYDDTAWSYKTIPACASNVVPGGGVGCEGNLAPKPGVTVNNRNTRGDNVGFFEDTNKGYRQIAEFASVDFDILPKVLTITGGVRHYDYKLDQRGWVGTSFGCFEAPAPCYGYGTNEDAEHLNAEYKGTKGRGNITWHITPDAMLYYTYSQGYRPGGFNRTSGKALFEAVFNAATGTYSKGTAQYIKPLAFAPDTLTNNEIGFKTEFLGHRLLINGSIYREDWKKVQTALFNPGVLGNLTLATNGADYRVNGAELQTTWRATSALSLIGSISYNDAKQVDSPFLPDNNPASPGFGKPITTYFSPVTRGPKTISNTFGSPNTPTAYSPKVQGNLRARYDWTASDYAWFVQAGALYVGAMFNNTNTDASVNGDSAALNNINTALFRFHMDSYTTYDASFGVAKDAWSLQVFGQNLANSHASTFTSTAQFVKTEIPLRPRVLGLRIGMKF